jgi:hypothetical protein
MECQDPLLLSPSQATRMLQATAGRCEVCGELDDAVLLQIHWLPEETHPDPHRRLLVLCVPCHHHIHRLPASREEQRAWVEQRPLPLRNLLRAIVGYRSQPYQPPECGDLSELYQAACSGWCLNGSG